MWDGFVAAILRVKSYTYNSLFFFFFSNDLQPLSCFGQLLPQFPCGKLVPPFPILHV